MDPAEFDSSSLERFYQLSLDAFCQLDPDGSIDSVSPTCCRLMQREPADLVGRCFYDLVFEEDRDQTEEHIRLAFEQGSVESFELRFPRPDGAVAWLSSRVRRHGEGLDCLLRDISLETSHRLALEASRETLERNMNERALELAEKGAALEQTEALFRAISEELPDALLLLDQESVPLGRIVHANPAACEQHGYTSKEMTSMTVFELDDEPTAESNRKERLAVVQSGKTVTFEGHHKRKDGSVFPVEVVAREIIYQGRRLVLAIERDLSERRRQEEERQELEARVRKAEKLETLGALAGGIAHAFNNLLVGIMGNAGLALDELPVDTPVKPFLRGIEEASERAAELCRQMLAYSGKGQFVLHDIRLDEMVREMRPLLWASISRKAELEIHTEPVPKIRADIDQMRQLLLNLIANASDALGEQSGSIVVDLGQVLTTETRAGDELLDEDLPPGRYILLKVTDTGVGMNSEIRERLFDPFFSTKFTGRGMGLAAVLGIVRGHHGTIRVHSEPGHGTTLEVLLPALDEGATMTNEEAETKSPAAEILVVDDEPAVRRVAERTLQRAGYTVALAEGGQEAIDLFTERPDAIGAVVLDLSMPAPDGKETFFALRRIRGDLPVIMSSGYAANDTAALFSGDRPAAFLQKPYRPRQLLELLDELVSGPPIG